MFSCVLVSFVSACLCACLFMSLLVCICVFACVLMCLLVCDNSFGWLLALFGWLCACVCCV